MYIVKFAHNYYTFTAPFSFTILLILHLTYVWLSAIHSNILKVNDEVNV